MQIHVSQWRNSTNYLTKHAFWLFWDGVVPCSKEKLYLSNIYGRWWQPNVPRMAQNGQSKHTRLRLVLVRKSPTVRTEGFDAFFCTRRSSWKLAQRFHSYCNLKISEETAGRWWLKAAPLFGFYTPTEKLCSGQWIQWIHWIQRRFESVLLSILHQFLLRQELLQQGLDQVPWYAKLAIFFKNMKTELASICRIIFWWSWCLDS